MPRRKNLSVVRSTPPLITVNVNRHVLQFNAITNVIYVHIQTDASANTRRIVNIGSTEAGYLDRVSQEKLFTLSQAGVFAWHTDCFFKCREPAAFRDAQHRFDQQIAYIKQVETFLTDLWSMVDGKFPVGNGRQGGFGNGGFMRVGILTFLQDLDIFECLAPSEGTHRTKLKSVLKSLRKFLDVQKRCQDVHARRRGRNGINSRIVPRNRRHKRTSKYGHDVCGISFDKDGRLTGIGYPKTSSHLFDPDVSTARSGQQAYFPTVSGMKDLEALAKYLEVDFRE